MIYALTGGIGAFVPFLLLPVLTHRLSAVEFGILSLVETTVIFTTPFVLSGIQGAINAEFFHLSSPEYKKYINNAFSLTFIAFLLVLIFVSFVVILFPDVGGIPSKLIFFVPLFALARNISSIVLSVFQIRQETNKYVFYYITQTILNLSLSYGLVEYINLGYWGRLEGLYGALFISALFGVIWLKRLDMATTGMEFCYSKKILKFSLPLIPHALSGSVLSMSDRFFISSFEDVAHVGTYSIAYQISSIMIMLSTAISLAWTPMLYALLKVNTEESKQKIVKFTYFFVIVFILFSGCIYLLSDYIFLYFINEKYFEAKLYFPWLLLGFCFQSIYFLFSSSFFFYKRTGLLSSITVSLAITNIVLNYLLVKNFKTMGVAYSTTITWFLFMCLTAIVAWRSMNKSFNK